MFDGPMLIELDERADYSEERWIGSGFLRNQVAVVVSIARRHEVIRIITARQAKHYALTRFQQYLTY